MQGSTRTPPGLPWLVADIGGTNARFGLIEDADGVYAFARDLGEQHAYVVLNRSDKTRTIKVPVNEPDGTRLVNWLDESQAKLESPVGDRPLLKARGHHLVQGGLVEVKLKPYESATLSRS